ncbi:TPA: acyltransferase [Candidatus Acetothermia bacterium]|nr:acyltransferase [Candidatus Acetothermia bacterium]
MRIGYVQMEPIFGEVRRNLRHAKNMMRQQNADLWVLPELFATGYQFTAQEEATALAEPVPEGPTTQDLITFAHERRCHIVAGLAESHESNVYNSAVLVGPSGFLTRYRKVHLFSEEKCWFTPGDIPFPVIDIGEAKVGMMICFDHFFPEVARTLTLQGAQIIAHPANLVMPVYAQLTMRARAIENGVFTVTANRVGSEARTDKRLRFTGESQIVSPSGDILVQSSKDKQEARVVKIDPAVARDKSLNPYNDRLADRRVDFYNL